MKTYPKRIAHPGAISTVLTLLTFILFFTIPGNLFAQKNWGIEFRPGADFAIKKLGDATLKPGFGFEGTVRYNVTPSLSAYAGWSWNKFKANESFAGKDNDFEETGYTFGLRFAKPLQNSKLSFLIEAGGIYNHIEIENTDGNIIADSKHGPGWQVGVGIMIPLSESFQLTPTIRYRALSRDIAVDDIKTPIDLNYISIGLGLGWKF